MAHWSFDLSIDRGEAQHCELEAEALVVGAGDDANVKLPAEFPRNAFELRSEGDDRFVVIPLSTVALAGGFLPRVRKFDKLQWGVGCSRINSGTSDAMLQNVHVRGASKRIALPSPSHAVTLRVVDADGTRVEHHHTAPELAIGSSRECGVVIRDREAAPWTESLVFYMGRWLGVRPHLFAPYEKLVAVRRPGRSWHVGDHSFDVDADEHFLHFVGDAPGMPQGYLASLLAQPPPRPPATSAPYGSVAILATTPAGAVVPRCTVLDALVNDVGGGGGVVVRSSHSRLFVERPGHAPAPLTDAAWLDVGDGRRLVAARVAIDW